MIVLIFGYAFMRHALLGALFASVLCAVVGTIVVEKRIVMMSGGVAHGAFGGIGLGYLLGFEPIWGAFLFAAAGAAAVVAMKRSDRRHSDGLVGILWALGMALGVLFIYLSPGYPPDMTTYLFGDILTIRIFDLALTGGLTLTALAFAGIFWQPLKAYLFDEAFAEAMGAGSRRLDYMTYLLIGISVVGLIRLVGIILAIALLTIPPLSVKRFARSLASLMGFSAVFGIASSLSGLALSYVYGIPSGATIILVASAGFLLTRLVPAER